MIRGEILAGSLFQVVARPRYPVARYSDFVLPSTHALSARGAMAGLIDPGLDIVQLIAGADFQIKTQCILTQETSWNSGSPLLRIADHIAEKANGKPARLIFDHIDHNEQWSIMRRMRCHE